MGVINKMNNPLTEQMQKLLQEGNYVVALKESGLELVVSDWYTGGEGAVSLYNNMLEKLKFDWISTPTILTPKSKYPREESYWFCKPPTDKELTEDLTILIIRSKPEWANAIMCGMKARNDEQKTDLVPTIYLRLLIK